MKAEVSPLCARVRQTHGPTPFVWHKTAEQILERMAAYRSAVLARN